jgi:hypothetical protein
MPSQSFASKSELRRLVTTSELSSRVRSTERLAQGAEGCRQPLRAPLEPPLGVDRPSERAHRDALRSRLKGRKASVYFGLQIGPFCRPGRSNCILGLYVRRIGCLVIPKLCLMRAPPRHATLKRPRLRILHRNLRVPIVRDSQAACEWSTRQNGKCQRSTLPYWRSSSRK